MNEKVEANVEAEALAEVEVEVVSLLYQSLLRVCGGGIASRREMKIDTSSTPCHEQVESVSAPAPESASPLTTVSSTPVPQWRKNLEDLAMKSIHFPNGNCSGSNDGNGNGNGNGNDSKSGSKSGNGTGSNNNYSDDNFGKGHDIEIKIALSLFHRYRSHGNRNCNHNSNGIKDDADMNRNGNGNKSGERKEMSKKQKNKLMKLEKKRRRLRGGNGNSSNIDNDSNNNNNSSGDNNEVPTTSIANATAITQNHVDNNTIKKKKIKINETIVKKCDDNNNNMIVKSSTPTATSSLTSTSKRCDTATLNIISDLGLVRNISSPNELAILLVKDMEDQLWEQRTSTITAVTSMSTSTSKAPLSVPSTAAIHNNDHNDNACNSVISGSSQNMNKCIISQKQKQNQNQIMMIQSNQSGIICIVTKKRFIYLRNHDRYPCSHCIKWCKGQKGLWWHEQIVHGLDHSSATVVAAASSSLLDCTALVVYNERTSKNNINSSSSKSVGQMIDEGGEMRNKEKKKKEGNDPFFDSIKNGNLNEFIQQQQQQQPQQSQPHQLQCKTYDPKSHLDKNGASALHWAAGCGHLMIVKYLIEKCHCPPDQIQQGKRSFHGRTPLHWSARNGHLQVVKYLIEECDIDIDARTIDGTTAFCWASWQGHLSIMEFLHSKRADVTSVNSFGCNAILWSAQSTQSGLHAIQFLEKIGCDVERVNSNGHGILHKSAQRGKKDVCDWIFLRMRRSMLESGTSTYPREGGGSHKELSNHNKGLDTISLMMIAPDAENCCPSDLAGMEGHYELAKWLVEQEIKVCMESLDVKNKPPWLQEGLLNAKHLANRCGLDDLWEGGSAIKKIAVFIENEQKKKVYLD